PAELLTEGQRPLQVELGAALGAEQRGARQGLVRHVHREGGAVCRLAQGRHRQAAAVAGDRAAEREARERIMAGDAELAAVAVLKNAYVADDAGEHARFLCQALMRSGPKLRAAVMMNWLEAVSRSSPPSPNGFSPSLPAGPAP